MVRRLSVGKRKSRLSNYTVLHAQRRHFLPKRGRVVKIIGGGGVRWRSSLNLGGFCFGNGCLYNSQFFRLGRTNFLIMCNVYVICLLKILFPVCDFLHLRLGSASVYFDHVTTSSTNKQEQASHCHLHNE